MIFYILPSFSHRKAFATGTRAVGLLVALLLGTQVAYGQSDSLSTLARQFTAYSQQALPEKLYLHLDRPLYLSGEILWFKINAIDGTVNKPLALSKVAYVEVLDKEQRPVLQTKVLLRQAKGQGSLVLPASLASGNYTVRAYTSWMKNFPADTYFHSTVTILNTRASLGLKATQDSAAYSVQFFPEGGSLVKGVASNVAFQVTDKMGRGLAATGTVVDQQGKTVQSFSTLKHGLGHFVFTPKEAGATYTAIVKLPGATALSRKLPAVAAQGYVLRVEDNTPTQLRVTIESTVAGQAAEELFLLGHSRQQVSVSAGTRLQDGKATLLLDKKKLAEGVTHLTVFNHEKKPVCERLYFTRPTRQLTVAASTSQKVYAGREKVTLQLSTNTLPAQPTAANLSVAVYRLDSLATQAAPDINSYLWLTSDLKGTVENPDYYFTATGPEVAQATDDLMLTHGWSRFRWTDVLARPARPFEFAPELNALSIRARVLNTQTGRPAPNIYAYMGSPSRWINLYNSLSNQEGIVQFEASDLYGPNDLIIQTNTSRDSVYRLELLNPFAQNFRTSQALPLQISELNKQDIVNRSLEMQVQNAYFSRQQALYKPHVTDSIPFYGKPDETYMLDAFTRFKVLEEVMREYVPGVQVRIRKDGFHFMNMDHLNNQIFPENPMVLLDGVPVFNINKIMAFDPLKIQKLDVITSNYFQGSAQYSGIVSFITYKGDLAGFPVDSRALIQEYEGFQQQREFYSPSYATPEEKQSRLPDLRNLLYWNPDVTTSATGTQTLEFYTADQAGTYLVVAQGITPSGLAGTARYFFEVKQTL